MKLHVGGTVLARDLFESAVKDHRAITSYDSALSINSAHKHHSKRLPSFSECSAECFHDDLDKRVSICPHVEGQLKRGKVVRRGISGCQSAISQTQSRKLNGMYLLLSPLILTTDLVFLLGSEVILDVEGLTDLVGALALVHVGNRLAADI